MRIGILTGGGDVPGLNPCIRALVYRAIEEGHQVVGIRRGWEGLIEYNPDDPAGCAECTLSLDKRNTRTIDRTGGTMLHTSRINPASAEPEEVPAFLRGSGFVKDARQNVDLTPHILRVLDGLELDVLVPIGGDDTLKYAARLYEEGFPIIAIPKTMDNDVYGTDYCIGYSTAVTRSVQFIHQMRTPAGSHERLTIVELFGRSCGEACLTASYLAAVDRCIIPEAPFDPEKLARLVVEDRQRNPSHYAMITIADGARVINEIPGAGQPVNIGLYTSEAIKKYSKLDTMYQELGYLMRSGAPDSLDLMVAVNFAQLAMEQIGKRSFGHMIALLQGQYTVVEANTPIKGIKLVDVDELYDKENYRPRLRAIEGKPMFLY
jgi:ATP-dependent phosphofructokinase / diphosphate-dependent phosphofructokinase